MGFVQNRWMLCVWHTLGRGALKQRRRRTGRSAGAVSRENAGMSSEKDGENPSHRKPKVS